MMKNRTLLSIVLIVTLSLSAGTAFLTLSVSGSAAASQSWTIMVYMADDYSVTLSWQDDLNEMEAARQAPGTNIIALVDDYGPNNSMLLKVANDPNFLSPTIVSTIIDDGGAVITGGEVNMADPATLEAFIRFTVSSYPADKLVLILWGHGASWRGLCPDGTDILTLPELGLSLEQVTGSIGRSLDMIVVDSCAEANMEMFTQVRGYTTLFVGSEKDVPSQGLPYVLVMNDLATNPDQGPARFGGKIVDDYVSWSTTNTDYSVTMGVFNLTKLDSVMPDLNAVSTIGSKYDRIFHESMRLALVSSEQHEDAFRVDFADFMWRLSSADLPVELKYHALNCFLKIHEVVEHFDKHSNPDAPDGIQVPNATGLSIYAPNNSLADLQYQFLAFAATPWYAFGEALRNSTVTSQSSAGPTVTLQASMVFDSQLYSSPPIDTANLVWSGDYDNVSAVVFRSHPGGLEYVTEYVSLGNDIEFACPGNLVVAASAVLNDEVLSYKTLNFTLQGMTSVRVAIYEDGDRILDVGKSHYTARLVMANGSSISPGAQLAEDDVFKFLVKVPDTANFGDLITIEIIDKSSSDVVDVETVSIPTAEVRADIDSSRNAETDLLVPLLFAALPGLLVLLYAVMMDRQSRSGRSPKR